ncbi:hypothetical protein [uncultured Thiohalocapsa sp.]|uniref:hypothetical protein n=1 Tax=uncultured Thiohalocapsa sp. TaxID=768990 RepID=UPI0025CCBB64|nr:hypothetical protein [uncultured Thiohalocapsa sp.]
MTCLYRFACADVPLADCLAKSFAQVKLHGLLQAPGAIRLVTWPHLHDDEAGSLLSQVYEARLFNEDGELRWLRDPEAPGTGRAAWITEADAPAPVGFTALPSLTDLETLRGGKILSYGNDFPGAQVPGGLGGYRVCEYIGRAPEPAGTDGNRIIVEHRLLSILTPAEAAEEIARDEGVAP